MKMRRMLSTLLLITMLFTMLGSVPISAQTSDVGYIVSGRVISDNEMTLDISLHGVKALSGKLAIAFDPDKLQLADTSSLMDAVQNPGNVAIVTEGLDNRVLMSNLRGYVMFAWYSGSMSGINAQSNDEVIASIPLKIINGTTTDDFSRNTIRLHYVNSTMADKWDCSAQIVSTNLVAYRNNDKKEEYLCNVTYDYPNCDYIPPVFYETRLRITDYNDNPINAQVTLDSFTSETDASGEAVFEMEEGVYTYRVSADGYETRSGYVIVEADETVRIPLMSHYQIAKSTAENLEIGYAPGDDASSVTDNISLPQTGENGETITWRSSNTNRIKNSGVVVRGDDDENVVLTATVKMGSASVNRTFTVTVKSLLSAEEKSAIILNKDYGELEIGYAPGDSSSSVTINLTLKEMCSGGSYVVWSSSNEDVITPYGIVIRPENDTEVKLTATLIRGTLQKKKQFTVKVKGEKKTSPDNPPDNQTENVRDTVQAVADSLKIGYADGDSASSVTQAITLPSMGSDNTVIEWESSNPVVVTSYGGVVRQTTDCDITLTATISKGTVSLTKTFNIKVKAADIIPVNPDNGQEQEIKDKNNLILGSVLLGDDDITDTPKPTMSPEQTPEPSGTDAPSKTDRFSDISTVPWAREAILALADRGVINGTGPDTYSPNNNIRRADFIMLLTKLLKLDGEITESFDDVTADKYYYESVARAKSMGVISGVGNNKFNPEGSITRQDMITMTYRALVKLGMAGSETADLSRFKDVADISDYAVESVSNLVGAGYIAGDDNGNVNPKKNTTRAEAAVFLYRLGN